MRRTFHRSVAALFLPPRPRGSICGMTVMKLSVSFDEELAGVVRAAASDEGLSVSAWLSNAAQDRIRNRLLRTALDELEWEGGPMGPEEAAMLVEEARRDSIVTGQGQDHAA